MAVSSYINDYHDLANFKILNNLNDLNAYKAVKDPADTEILASSKANSNNDTITINASNIFKLSLT